MFNHQTYLSEDVRRLFTPGGSICTKLVHQCVNQDLTLNWSEVDDYLGRVSAWGCNGDRDEYIQGKVALLWPLLEYTFERLKHAEERDIERMLHNCCLYVNDVDIKQLYGWFQQGKFDLLIILKLTSEFERLLGDIFLLKGDKVPFLLKDLLEKPELDEILGTVQVRVLRLLIGNVKGINARNIAWHGFISEGEIKPSLIVMLFILLASVSHELNSFLKNACFNRRDKTQDLTKQAFLLETKSIDDDLAELIDHSPIPKSQKFYWCLSVDLYKQKNFSSSIVLILPLFEHFLRLIFCSYGQLDESFIKAQSTEYYIILDDMLEREYQGRKNIFINIFPKEVIEMLLDLFFHPAGPRLRDRISHNEIKINSLPDSLVKFTFNTVSLIIRRIMQIEYEIFYTSKFHVTSLLVRFLKTLVSSVQSLDKLPRPDELEVSFEFYDVLSSLREIEAIQLDTLYRPKQEIQAVQKLQLVSNGIMSIITTVKENCEERYRSWLGKQMRSRGRENYIKMHKVIPVLKLTLCTVVQNIITTLSHLQARFDSKYFGKCLKLVENLTVLAGLNCNKWGKIEELCNAALIESTVFRSLPKNKDVP